MHRDGLSSFRVSCTCDKKKKKNELIGSVVKLKSRGHRDTSKANLYVSADNIARTGRNYSKRQRLTVSFGQECNVDTHCLFGLAKIDGLMSNDKTTKQQTAERRNNGVDENGRTDRGGGTTERRLEGRVTTTHNRENQREAQCDHRALKITPNLFPASCSTATREIRGKSIVFGIEIASVPALIIIE